MNAIKKALPFLLTALLAVLLTACASEKAGEAPQWDSSSYSDYSAESAKADFAGKNIGVILGMVADTPVRDALSAVPVFYQDTASAINDLRNRRIDGLIYDLAPTRIVASLPENQDLMCIGMPRDLISLPVGAVSSDQNIIDRFNAFLEEEGNSGELADMQNRWLESMSALDAPMPSIPLTDKNGTLRVAVDDAAQPYTYRGNDGELRGFCVELASRFAQREGMAVDFITMDFSGLIPYVGNGKADLGLDFITITDERKQAILFSDPFYYGPQGILVLKQTADTVNAAKTDFISWLKAGIDRNLLTENRWKMAADGLGVTMIISLLAQIFGTVLGGFICWLLKRKNKPVRKLGALYCGLMNGTPIVVLLMIAYYIVFGSTTISNVLVAVAAFTMVTGAGVAVNLKSAIDTVDTVEVEAARGIGFSAFRAFKAVTLPQAVRRVLPAYTDGFVELVKATAVVGYIAIQDLTRAGDIIRSRTYDAYFPLLFVTVVYLIVTTICVRLFKLIINKVNGNVSR